MKSGITESLTVTQESPSTVGSGVWLVETVSRLKFEPSTLIRPPPVRGWLASPVLTTLVTFGLVVVASKFEGSTVNPDCVRRMIAFPFASGAIVRVNGLTFASGTGGGGGAPGAGVTGSTMGNGTIGDSAVWVGFEPTPVARSTRCSTPEPEAPGVVARTPKLSIKAKPEDTPLAVSIFLGGDQRRVHQVVIDHEAAAVRRRVRSRQRGEVFPVDREGVGIGIVKKYRAIRDHSRKSRSRSASQPAPCKTESCSRALPDSAAPCRRARRDRPGRWPSSGLPRHGCGQRPESFRPPPRSSAECGRRGSRSAPSAAAYPDRRRSPWTSSHARLRRFFPSRVIAICVGASLVFSSAIWLYFDPSNTSTAL